VTRRLAPGAFSIALLSAVSIARADPPVTTVVFGVPARTIETVRPAERPCPRAVTVERRIGGERERMSMPLLDCAGRPRDEALLALSVLARPRGLAAPAAEEMRRWREQRRDPSYVAEGIRSVHPALLDRLQRIGDAFEGRTIEIFSGQTPRAPRSSRHHHARALDLNVRGVERESVRDLALTFDQTGIGFYPDDVFIHLDVRERSAYWTAGERFEGTPDDLARIRRETDEMLRGLRIDP
jgi:hypothetical protein